jgi:hypothetical protein
VVADFDNSDGICNSSMNVPTPLDFILMMLWPAALYVAVWGIIIGRRQDRLAKVVEKLYGVLGLALQTPWLQRG